MAMTGLEVPGFLIGLNGIVPLIEKSLKIWQSISEAKAFGSDMMGLVAQLSMEYYRFLAWGRVSGALRGSSGHPSLPVQTPTLAPKPSSSNFPFPKNDPCFLLEAPVEDIAARIVALFEDVAQTVAKYKQTDNASRNNATTPSITGKSTSVALGLSTVLPIFGAGHSSKFASTVVQQRESAGTLQDKTSFRRRFTFSSKPWGEPDKVTLHEKVKELCYWNDRLEKLLPDTIRLALGTQALPSQLLVDENKEILATLIAASENQNEAVRAHAKLWKERINFAGYQKDNQSEVEKYRQSPSALGVTQETLTSYCDLSLRTFKVAHEPPVLVAVEWYSFGSLEWDPADVLIATTRITELAHLSSISSRPESLRILSGICFVEEADSLGLVYRLPRDANPTTQPVSLHYLLHHGAVIGFRRPGLEQRLQLAQQIASSIHSFGLVRWLHKDFNCRNVIFFRDTSPNPMIMLESPYVTGFSIARPDNENEKSLNKDLEALSIYLHPDLRVKDPEQRPKYARKYDIYSLGLVLFEIAIWQPIDRVIKVSFEPEDFKKTVVDRCSKDLPFYVGKRYRDVVLRCLMCADGEAEEGASSLDTVYWSIVLELAKCR